MPVPAQLEAAVSIFRELGWADALESQAAELPLGSAAQRRDALAGLSSGEWGDWQRVNASAKWVLWVDVNPWMLSLFAIRMGVSAQRAATLLQRNRWWSSEAARIGGGETLTRVLVQRGERFAEQFVAAPAAYAVQQLQLVTHFQLAIPPSIAYLEGWAQCSCDALALGATAANNTSSLDTVPLATVQARYVDHARIAVELGIASNGPFGKSIPLAVKRGWLGRDEAIQLAFAGLDLAQRPSDRVAWARMLANDLEVSAVELAARADAVVSALAQGDPVVIETLAPPLITDVAAYNASSDASGTPSDIPDADDILADVLTVGLAVKTKKAKLVLLRAAAQRVRPRPAVVETIAPAIIELAEGRDHALARAATAVMTAWNLSDLADLWATSTQARADEETRISQDGSRTQGYWRATPSLWQVPRFLLGEVSTAALTEAGAGLMRNRGADSALDTERFLALLNAVVREDEAGARTALIGVRQERITAVWSLGEWMNNEPYHYLDLLDPPEDSWRSVTIWGPDRAREAAVFQRLGEVPCLLSTPSWEDLRVDPEQLAERLRDYLSAQAVASEADLFLAMTRLDVSRVTEALVEEFRELQVPVVLQSGEYMRLSAGPSIAAYLRDPYIEPVLDSVNDYGQWTTSKFARPESLRVFPERLREGGSGLSYDCTPTAFPGWGDGAGRSFGYSVEDSALGQELRQLARRATPLTPGLAMNMLGAQRGFHEAAASDGSLAVIEAWDRGLLIPGVADVRLLDWRSKPTQLASLASACCELAEQGLLAVVWPVLDDLIRVSLNAPRILAGTAEVVDAIRQLLPEVQAAIVAGLAEASVVDLPGLRALAERSGTSRAVAVAKEVCALLPEPSRSFEQVGVTEPPVLDFDAVWPPEAGLLPAIDDGAVVTAAWVDPSESSKMIALDLEFRAMESGDQSPTDPTDPSGRKFRVVKGWTYDLQREGQCNAAPFAGDTPLGIHTDGVWLHWDTDAQRITVAANRDWREGTSGPLEDTDQVPPLTTSMVAVVLAGLCHDTTYAIDYSVREIIGDNLFGSAAVRVAMTALLQQPDVSPARLVRMLEQHPKTLATLWPILTESVRFAAAVEGTPPRWLNRVLDVALLHAPVLREAARRGLIPNPDAGWPGLAELASRTGSSAALTKARQLLEQLHDSSAAVTSGVS